MDLLEKLIARFVRFSLAFPKATLTIALLVTVVAAYLTGQIKIRTNFSDLLPNDNPIVVQAKELEKTVGGASFVVVAVEAGKTPEAGAGAGKFLDDLKAKLTSEDSGHSIRYIDDRPPTDFLKKASLLYLSIQDLDRLHDKIKLRIDQAKLKKMKLLIDFGAQGGFDEELEDLKTKYSTYVNPTAHYQNKDGTLLASLIKPDWRTTEVSRTQDLVNTLNATIAALDPKHYDPSLNVRLTGPYVKQLNQKNILLRDATVVSAISFIGSILYLVLHFRRKRAVFLIGVPLTVSTVWSMGLAYLFFGSLNLFSSASCAILLGLGAEFGIHFYTEYLHERRLGRPVDEALYVSMTRLGRAFLAAASTTAAAFFALAFTRFKALHELGIISGTGIILCGVAFVFMLPPLTLVLERWSPDKKLPKDWEEKKQSFSRSSIKWIFSGKNFFITGGFFLFTLVSVALGHLRFDYNLNHVMGSQDTKELDARIDGIFNHSVNPEVALAQSLEDAGKLASAIRAVQEKNAATPQGTTIKGALALSDFIPTDQETKREKIAGIKALFTPVVMKYMGDEDKKSYDQLEPMLDPPQITLQALPPQITNKFLDKTGALGRLAFIFPNFDPTQADRFMRFVAEIKEVQCPDCSGPFYASGESTVFSEIVRLLSHEGRYVIGFTVLMILGALWVNFRSLTSMALVFAPLVLGIAGTLGVMGLIGLPFNIINVAAIPIIIGTTDDYGVHLYQRINDDPDASLQDSFRMTFRPIVGSAVSALIGFGSLGFAQMGGIRSFGLVCVVGITLCTLATLFWFPALLALVRKRATPLKRLEGTAKMSQGRSL